MKQNNGGKVGGQETWAPDSAPPWEQKIVAWGTALTFSECNFLFYKTGMKILTHYLQEFSKVTYKIVL